MWSLYHLYLFFLLLTIKLISAEEITIQSLLSNLPEINHEKVYYEIRDQTLPEVRRMSRKMQSIIIKATEAYSKMQEYKNVTNQTCLSSSLVFNMTKLSRNLTRIMQKDVPLIEEEINRIVPHMGELQKQIDELMDFSKQQEVPRLNMEQLEKLQKLTDIYQKWNDQLRQIHQQVTRMMDETIRPGLQSVEEYNTCLGSTAQSLIDYGLDQLVEHADDDDDDDDQLFPFEDLSSFHNHTDL